MLYIQIIAINKGWMPIWRGTVSLIKSDKLVDFDEIRLTWRHIYLSKVWPATLGQIKPVTPRQNVIEHYKLICQWHNRIWCEVNLLFKNRFVVTDDGKT